MWFQQCPEGINSRDFGYAKTISGSAFRQWCELLRHKGVFIGFHNHEWCVRFSSNPFAEWIPGCQDARAYGSCWPKPVEDGVRFVSFDGLPEEAKPLAEEWIREAIEIARQRIEDGKKRKRLREQEEERKRDEDYVNNVITPWLKAVSHQQ